MPDTNQNNVTNEPRYQMGDPLHSQPVSVIYGPTLSDGVLYFATNDGYLHAIDIATGNSNLIFVGYADGGFDTSKTPDQQASNLYGFGVSSAWLDSSFSVK